MTDRDLWQHLEADFARVLGEVPKPEGPTLPYGYRPMPRTRLAGVCGLPAQAGAG